MIKARLLCRGAVLPGRRRLSGARPTPWQAVRRSHRGFIKPRSAPVISGSALSHQNASDGPAQAGGQPAGDPSSTLGSFFSWEQQWYPLVPLSYLTRSKPAAFSLLGRRLVVWFHEPSRRWLAMEDRCPHRLAPLSEGRLEPGSGNLQCSYLGWQFGPDGRCAAVPQADSQQAAAAALHSPRSCVAAFPVRQVCGLLWVWMDPASPDAAHGRPLPLPPELLDGGAALLGDWYQRDLPVSAQYLLENLVDPAHVHHAHHGVIGQRDRAGSVPLRLEGMLTAQGGFRVSAGSTGGASGGGTPAVTHFLPPGLVRLEFPALAGAAFSMLFFAVPVGPGVSRLVAGYAAEGLPAAASALLRSEALAPLLHSLQFLADLGSHRVLDGDTVHIYRQEQAVREEQERAVREEQQPGMRHGSGRAYFMPAAADRGVVLLHRWLDECAGGGPSYAAGAAAHPRRLTRREILDRYEQHTRSCPSCRRALGVVRATRTALQAGTTASLAAAFALAAAAALLPSAGLGVGLAGGPRAGAALGRAPLLLGAAALAAAAFGGAAVRQALAGLEQEFVFVDYDHSSK